MMTVEQYSNQEFSELYQQRFVEMMFKYYEELFKSERKEKHEKSKKRKGTV